MTSDEDLEYQNDYKFLVKIFSRLMDQAPYIVAVSAYQGSKFEERAMRFNIDEVLQKPVQINQLKKLINQHLKWFK